MGEEMKPRINLSLPPFEELKKIRVRLDKPRLIIYKDNRKTNSNQKTIIPSELKNYENKKGIYIICKENKVSYVGATENFKERMVHHNFLKRNPTLRFVFFLEENDKSKRFLFEMIYKFHYFGKVKAEWKHVK